ncbi:MAG: VWA domain-containing protein [Candidatus Cloacimonetes bacterium]|nr:VWA domain-containing protein [Candidatus Cloacimonadota bacterium]
MKRVLLGTLLVILIMGWITVSAGEEREKAEESSVADSLQTTEKIDDWQFNLNTTEVSDKKTFPLPNAAKQSSEVKASAGSQAQPIQDIVGIQAGAANVDGEIHIRGSRANEVNYTVDGVTVSAPSFGSTPRTGGFTAEYGNAQSGVVSFDNELGFSVGGAKDVDNFRLNIENGYLPLLSSITYEGLFYDYYFNTQGVSSETEDMFSPSYNIAQERNPLTDEEETWLSVGLNSNIKESDFGRKKLNLVVVLDISGSMRSPFNQYYYDGGRRIDDGDQRSKLEIATETICSMLDHLEAEDRFGMVLFENRAFLAKPLNRVGDTDMDKIKQHIMDLRPQGGTNMYAGMQSGTQLYDKYLNADKSEYENRIIFLTDAMPNRELTDKNSLWGVLDENADKGLYATIIGVGVDFQTRLVEHISKVEGANYYSIHSAKEFKKRLDEEFEYMVTPLVFNLNLVVDVEGYEIMRVCGTPYSEESKGELLKVGTLFPSPSVEGEVKGGIILVELKRTAKDGQIYLLAGYDDRNGKHFQNRLQVDFKKVMASSRLSPGLQKGVLLVHYADLLKEWVEYMRNPESGEKKLQGTDDWQYRIPPQRRGYQGLNEWEQRSMPLAVNAHYQTEFIKFRDILLSERERLEDKNLQQEIDLLNLLINYRVMDE